MPHTKDAKRTRNFRVRLRGLRAPLRRTAETQRNAELWHCTLGHFRPHTPPQPFLREEVRVAGDGAPDPEGSGAARRTREEAPRVTMRENRPRISRISQMACKPDGLWRDRPGSPVPDSAILAAMLSRSFLSVPFAPSAVKPGLETRLVVEAQPRPRRWGCPRKMGGIWADEARRLRRRKQGKAGLIIGLRSVRRVGGRAGRIWLKKSTCENSNVDALSPGFWENDWLDTPGCGVSRIRIKNAIR